MTTETFLTPAEVASMLLVSPTTVRQWALEGKLPSRFTPGGHRRFELDEVRRFARERGIALANDVRHRTILVVDDDVAVNNLVVDILSAWDDHLELLKAHDGFEAGMLIQKHRPDYVVLDLMMPGMDGFEVCKFLKNNPDTAHIHVVAMTGHYTSDIVDRIISLGADTCLSKPLNQQELIKACGLSADKFDEPAHSFM